MTSKKRRQRGSRTHGGGTHKNRRGAGNRGGRGAAGRDKHEFHNYEPLGKSGFSRPEGVTRDVATVDVRTLDEDITLLAAEGLAESTEDGYRVDTRSVVDDAADADVVKVLGGGQVHTALTVVADAFSAAAREKLAAAGGAAELTERGRALAETDEDTTEDADES